jgi:hypothetical protein
VNVMNTRRVIPVDDESAAERAERLKEPEWQSAEERAAIIAKRLQDRLDQSVIEREKILSQRPGHVPYHPRGRRRLPVGVDNDHAEDSTSGR